MGCTLSYENMTTRLITTQELIDSDIFEQYNNRKEMCKYFKLISTVKNGRAEDMKYVVISKTIDTFARKELQIMLYTDFQGALPACINGQYIINVKQINGSVSMEEYIKISRVYQGYAAVRGICNEPVPKDNGTDSAI